MKLALVCTLIRATTVLADWVAYHRALGVQQFYLFVDDPDELPAYAALPLGEVQLIPRDEALLAAWQATRDYDYHSAFIGRQVYSRQCLNANLAMQKARAAGCDWLLHLDIDERLHVPEGEPALADFFAAHANADMVAFTNHEAVPEQWHIDNYFEEVTLFKRNLMVLDESQRRIAQALFRQPYFLAYANGKSAVNLHGSAVEADGSHAFRPIGKLHLECRLCVLHYTHCGFNWFHSKFATLGEFEDKLMGFSDITQLFPMLVEGRASVVRGSIHEATRLYRDRVLHQGGLPHSLRSLLDAGVLMRTATSPLQAI
ncbi:MAG: glycosyltransferase family 2 protein [Pseudomonadota bacterium]